MATLTPIPGQGSLQELDQTISDWIEKLIEGLREHPEAVDLSFVDRFLETAKRGAFQLNGELPTTLAPEAKAEIREIIVSGLEVLEGYDETRPLDMIDDFLVRAESIRHLVRDALDSYASGDERDAGMLVSALDEWLPSRKEQARIVHLSPRHLRRLASEGGRPSRRLLLVARLVALLRRAWTPEGIAAWFDRPRKELDAKAPIDLLDDPDYEQALTISAQQGRAQHGS